MLTAASFQDIRWTHRAREGPGANGSPKYWVFAFPSRNSMMLNGVRRFTDPEAARANDPPRCKAFPVRLRGARRLNIPPPADALARLRVFPDTKGWV